MGEKLKFWLKASVLGLLALFIGLWAFYSFLSGQGIASLLMAVVFALIIIFGAKFMLLKYEQVKTGMPQEDELSRKVMHKAGYYSFIATIYVLLALGFYTGTLVEEQGYPPMLPRHVAAAAIAASCLIFGVLYLYFSRKGDA